ncbi:hypothetical protein PPSIR1_32557 [Plesiocystis pacifica SIR-1]|uniref:Uncharacterized protein n=1 Tax=Plesiocystis pacifica SIR-1 TaxID=391625 RepID=A6G5P7_9BACT|nr:hypothetical protein PPSIR1_32557 [Plesiocystis pacifica SIR-1]
MCVLAPLACTDDADPGFVDDESGSEGGSDDAADEVGTESGSTTGTGEGEGETTEESGTTEEEPTESTETGEEESTQEESTAEESETGEPLPPCDPGTICEDAENLGTVNGDTSSPPLIAYGNNEAIYRFRVNEDYGGFLQDGYPQEVRVELMGAEGANYDLFVNRSEDDDSTPCKEGGWTSAEPGSEETISLEWGETYPFANGSDDSRDLMVHVFSDQDVCDPDLQWTLIITGNTL